MKLITISGLDGSGKSTQIQLLKEYLESKGNKVFYFHAIQFSLANKISTISSHCEHSEAISEIATSPTAPRNDNKKSVTKANIFQIALRKLFLQIDIWRFKLLLNELLNKEYDYILSDRFFHDSIINIAYLENCDIGNLKLIGPCLPAGRNWKLKIGNSEYFYLQTDPQAIMQRERQPDQGLDYLQKKKELYDKYSIIWDMKIIDGNREKNIIFEELKNLCQI